MIARSVGPLFPIKTAVEDLALELGLTEGQQTAFEHVAASAVAIQHLDGSLGVELLPWLPQMAKGQQLATGAELAG